MTTNIIPTAEELTQQVIATAAAAKANGINVTMSVSYCKSSRQSSRLSEIANAENGSVDSATASIKFIPPEFKKAVEAMFSWAKQPIVDNAIKQPDTGKRPVYLLTTTNGIFDLHYQEMETRVADVPDYIRMIIEHSGSVNYPVSGKGRTANAEIEGYGGWDNFSAACFKLAGVEARMDDTLFPYQSTAEFISTFSMTYEAEVADPTKNIAQFSEFAQELLSNSRISSATKLFHVAIGESADVLADALRKINNIIPDPQVMQIRCTNKQTRKQLFKLSVDATECRATGKTLVMIQKGDETKDFESFSPVAGKPPIYMMHSNDAPVSLKKLEGVARKILHRKFPSVSKEDNGVFKPKAFDGGAVMKTSTFRMVAERKLQTQGYFAGTTEADFPLLHSALDTFYTVSDELDAIANSKSKSRAYEALAQIKPAIEQNIEAFETLLTV